MLIYTEKESSRLTYMGFYLSKVFGTEFKITSNIESCEAEKGFLNYSNTPSAGGIQISPHGLLFEKGIANQHIETKAWEDLPVFFFGNINAQDIPFDILSAIFYLVTRYEEYLPSTTDEHGRFSHESSLAYQQQFLQIPLVDHWLLKLAGLIQRKTGIEVDKRKYKFISTIDVDKAYAYKYHTIPMRQLAWAKSFLNGQYEKRKAVLNGKSADPFDKFDYIHQLHNKYSCIPKIFVQVGDYGKYDKNLSVQNGRMQKLIKNLVFWAEPGLHPSYASVDKPGKLKSEVNRLQKLLPLPLEDSRQHYLRFRLPDTYRNLMKQGIKNEFSMGYARSPGFRASTCSPYPYYDLGKESTTTLTIYPLTLMDVTLSHHLGLDKAQAMDKIKTYIDEVKRVNGTFISLWHNSSFTSLHQMQGWSKVFEFMLKEATS